MCTDIQWTLFLAVACHSCMNAMHILAKKSPGNLVLIALQAIEHIERMLACDVDFTSTNWNDALEYKDAFGPVLPSPAQTHFTPSEARVKMGLIRAKSIFCDETYHLDYIVFMIRLNGILNEIKNSYNKFFQLSCGFSTDTLNCSF